MDKFWSEDPGILFKVDKLREFFPTGKMSFSQKMNAITRFFIYFSILLYIIYQMPEILLLFVLGMILIYLIYKYKFDIVINMMERNKDIDPMPKKVDEVIEVKGAPKPAPSQSELKGEPLDMDEKKDQSKENTVEAYKKVDFASVDEVKDQFKLPSQTGGGDCSSCVKGSPYKPDSCKRGSKTALDANANLCQMPTRENPYMNVLVTDYADNPNKLPACNPEIVRNDIDNMYSNNLYRNVNDVWNKNNGQLIYNTQNWTTSPNDQNDFAKWLYNVEYVCKDGDMEACYRGAELQMPQMRHGKIYWD